MSSPDITPGKGMPVFQLSEQVVDPLPPPKSDAELDILIAEKNRADGVEGLGIWNTQPGTIDEDELRAVTGY